MENTVIRKTLSTIQTPLLKVMSLGIRKSLKMKLCNNSVTCCLKLLFRTWNIVRVSENRCASKIRSISVFEYRGQQVRWTSRTSNCLTGHELRTISNKGQTRTFSFIYRSPEDRNMVHFYNATVPINLGDGQR